MEAKVMLPSGADGSSVNMRKEPQKGAALVERVPVGAVVEVLAENGDPVMDMLYSLNWLPMAFSIAHYVTGDPWFRELWQAIAAFFAKIQIASADPLLDGVWPRAYDAAQGEVYGVPNDPGWAPWSVETGWTMSVIASGLMFGLMEEEIKPLFQ